VIVAVNAIDSLVFPVFVILTVRFKNKMLIGAPTTLV
jgi:hypothetical protein